MVVFHSATLHFPAKQLKTVFSVIDNIFHENGLALATGQKNVNYLCHKKFNRIMRMVKQLFMLITIKGTRNTNYLELMLNLSSLFCVRSEEFSIHEIE